MKKKNDYNRTDGQYSNYFKVGHNSDVFVIDSYQVFLEDNDNNFALNDILNPNSRIIASPVDAKVLMNQLKCAIEEFEKVNGPIPEPDNK